MLAIIMASTIIIGSVVFAVTIMPEPVAKKTWYAVPLESYWCMLQDVGSTSVIKINVDECQACTGISKNPSGQQLAQWDDKWQIDEGLVEIDYSLCIEPKSGHGLPSNKEE